MKSAVTVVAKIIGKRKRFDNVPKGISSIQPNGLLAQNRKECAIINASKDCVINIIQLNC